MHKKYKLIFFLLITLTIILISSDSYAADPKIVTTLRKGFESIEEWIIKISTPAAAVAVGTGVFMKKFSFGDEEKIVFIVVEMISIILLTSNILAPF